MPTREILESHTVTVLRKEVLDILGLKKQKAPAKSKDVPLKKVTKADIAELRKSIPKKKKIKKKPPLVDGKVQRKKRPVMIGDKPLTVTRADGSVRVLTKKDRKGNSAYGR